MMKNRAPIFKQIIICLLCFYSSQIIAQQTKVDSAIQQLNHVIVNGKLDTASFQKAMYILFSTPLTTQQMEQLETTSQQFEQWEKDGWPFDIQYVILYHLTYNDRDKAINYGKLQIEKLDKYSTPEVSLQKSYFLSDLRLPFRNSDRLEEGLTYFSQKLNTYKSQNDSILVNTCYYVLAGFYRISGLTDLAIYNMKKSVSYIDTVTNKRIWLNNKGVLGSYYLSKSDKREGLKLLRMVLKESPENSFVAEYLAKMMLQDNKTDSAAYFLNSVKKSPLLTYPHSLASFLQTEAMYYIQRGDLEAAESKLNECWQLIRTNDIPVAPGAGTSDPDYYLALIRIKQNKLDEAITLLISDIERLNNAKEEILRDYKLLAELYTKTGKSQLAAGTYARYIAMKDSLLQRQDKFRSISFEAEQQMNKAELAIERLESQNEISSLYRNFSIGIAALLLVLTVSIYYRFQSKKKANDVLNKTLNNLKSTQAQLIQSEKMASLGELTAGIAHEIQNPLNFVNNFSEVNKELIEEVDEELRKGNISEVKMLFNDIKENEEKISHHGKRADAIVKGMLEHSRTSTREKEPTKINVLADEFFRLAYHGLRAKDKTFNATLVSDYDDAIGKININRQDIGRVVLNLINNAFYVVNEKKKSGAINYEPTVSVITKKISPAGEGKESIQISVKDNGNGIPENIKEKIFQPFFTTKPTGSGTGLGLSLSYDIVKAHGGEIKIETKENEGSEFIIQLPIQPN